MREVEIGNELALEVGLVAIGIEMVASDSFADVLREQLAPVGHVTLRRMFGKTGVFCDGLMLAMVRDDALYFRVDDDNRALFKEAEAFPPLNYEKGGGSIDLAFWRAPERLYDEPDEFLTWARAALGSGATGCGEAVDTEAESKTAAEVNAQAAARFVPRLACFG